MGRRKYDTDDIGFHVTSLIVLTLGILACDRFSIDLVLRLSFDIALQLGISILQAIAITINVDLSSID